MSEVGTAGGVEPVDAAHVQPGEIVMVNGGRHRVLAAWTSPGYGQRVIAVVNEDNGHEWEMALNQDERVDRLVRGHGEVPGSTKTRRVKAWKLKVGDLVGVPNVEFFNSVSDKVKPEPEGGWPYTVYEVEEVLQPVKLPGDNYFSVPVSTDRSPRRPDGSRSHIYYPVSTVVEVLVR